MKPFFFSVSVFLLCFGTALAETPFYKTVPAYPGGEVSIEIIAGKLTITGWDRNEVSIEGVIGDDVAEVEIDSDENETSIEVKIDDHSTTVNEAYADLEIYIPRDSKLELESVAVEIAVYDLTGEIEIESVSGKISISGRPQSVEIESISGNLVIHDGAEEVEVESVSGSISIAGGVMSDVNVESVSGSVSFEGNLDGNGTLSIETVTGDVLVLVPNHISVGFELSTFNGRIVSEFGEMEIEEDRFTPAREARFSVGSGSDAEVSIETFSGTIEIMQK